MFKEGGALHQLGERVRAAIRRKRLPPELLGANAEPFLCEEFVDNVMAYVSVQVMEDGQRDDGWHSDGGASALHVGLTLRGERVLQIESGKDGGEIHEFAQSPGSIYIGNMVAMKHNVAHRDADEGGYKVAVMFRSNYWREARARTINTTPGPAELFHVVNDVIAEHLGAHPLVLPDLAAIAAEKL